MRALSQRLHDVLPATVAGLVLLLPSVRAQDDRVFTLFLAEIERHGGDERRFEWDAQGWAGTDYDKLAVKTEGEWAQGSGIEEAEIQLLYQRLVTRFFDLQAGLRYDFEPGPGTFFGVFGVQGLAPYFFEIDAALFLDEDADFSIRFEADYELLLTQRLILESGLEVDLAAANSPEREIGAGLNEVELGMELRYEIVREFAPYLGWTWQRHFGDTAARAVRGGGEREKFGVTVGIRFWF